MPRCISCGAYFELPPVGHEDDLGESQLCRERCSGADIETELARIEAEDARWWLQYDAASDLPGVIFMPDE